ncbi:M24 family metallopeptidase [Pseudonocardia hispaniensis]|uniref:M24 family metallopeptidase n=1 Tax=Pseudonocardia hispaniensis TaxID=904933 RepID=A0ABW1IXF4_9PSEU
MTRDLNRQRRARAQAKLQDADFDAFVSSSASTVRYLTDFRSMAAELYEDISAVVVAAADRVRLVIPFSQAAAALDVGVPEEEIVSYGEFYFDSMPPSQQLRKQLQHHDDQISALQAALCECAGTGRRIGVELVGMHPELTRWLLDGGHGLELCDASTWSTGVRASKLPGEIELLERSARITEQAIQDALAQARAGWREKDIARVMAESMLAHGAEPEFFSVQTGAHSALGDAFPGDRPWQPGEVLKMDLGCRVDGYWSDLGRTAVLGAPDAEMVKTYNALREGQRVELEMIKPGITTNELFDAAVDAVREAGLPSYARQHCGHGIGLAIYDPPLVRAKAGVMIEEGMVFCLETPYYRSGWGGMIVEDTVVVTSTGCRELSISSRELLVVETT